MYTIPPKKMLIISILKVLHDYSGEDHRLSQKDISDYLKKDYGVAVDRKAIKRNLAILIDYGKEYGYEIEYTESVRMLPNPKTGEAEENYILSDFYLVRKFTDSELRLLIDGLLFSKQLPYSQCKELIEKLSSLSNQGFKSHVKFIQTLPDTAPQNKQLFYTVEVLDEAINQGKQVAFYYNNYGTDLKLHHRKNKDGKDREYVVNPYQIAAANGRYYLICNYDKYDNVANYRLDRITDIRLLETPVKPAKQVTGIEHGFDLPQHMAEHIYMFTGESESVIFSFQSALLNEVVDWFGTGIEFINEAEGTITAKVYVNRMAMQKWAMQYALYAKVLSPQSLADAVRKDLEVALQQYNQ